MTQVYDFVPFSRALHDNFIMLSTHELFVTLSGETMKELYQQAFPEGTNPIFRKRCEYDCACCNQVIKGVGGVVAIIDGELRSVWDIEGLAYPFSEVAQTMSKHVKGHPITALFRTDQRKYGKPDTVEELEDKTTRKWNHHHVDIDGKHHTTDFVAVRGAYNTTAGLLRRSLDNLTADAISTVLDLCTTKGALYRGEENTHAVTGFKELHDAYHKLSAEKQDLFVWTNTNNQYAGFKNTAIGSLVEDLSAPGADLEKCVRSFEKKVAPENYKRPTSVITPAMISAAMAKITELGLEPALSRRHARLSDVSVNNVLWVNGSAQTKMKGGIESLLMEEAAPAKLGKLDAAEVISIDEFMQRVLPKAKNIEMLVRNKHKPNFVSLIAPNDPSAGSLFKWPNNFSWSYQGNLADTAMRQAVVARGGSVEGVFRFTHQWNYDKRNASLMDLHVFMPGSSPPMKRDIHDFYGNEERVGWNHRTHHRSGGVQDVDYTDAAPVGKVPVENITFPDLSKLRDGDYVCRVHNWALRPPTEGGFRAEIECGGQLYQYEVTRPLKNKEWVTVATASLRAGVWHVTHALESSTSSQEVWGVKTEQLQKVSTVMFSPNYWDDNQQGNKHWFFLLEGCKNPEPARGIYNEYLASGFEEHRKVFEVLGAKTKCPVTDEQLGGLGFSSTRGDEAVVMVTTDKARRAYNIKF